MIMSIRFTFFISRLYRNRSIKYHSFRAPNDGILFHELSTFCEQTIDNQKQTHVTCITSQIAVMWYLVNRLNVFLDKVVECCVRRMLKHVSNSQEKGRLQSRIWMLLHGSGRPSKTRSCPLLRCPSCINRRSAQARFVTPYTEPFFCEGRNKRFAPLL